MFAIAPFTMDKSLSLASLLALFLSLSTAHAEKPLCEVYLTGNAAYVESAYVQRVTGSQFQVKDLEVELQKGLLAPGIASFFANTPPELLTKNLTMTAGSDLTNDSLPAQIEIFAEGRIISRIEFRRHNVFAWVKQRDKDDEDFPYGQSVGFAQENDSAGTERRVVAIKDKKKSLNFSISIDVPCEVVGLYTSDYSSIRQVKTNAMGFPGVACRIPILKAKKKKPEVIFPGSSAE